MAPVEKTESALNTIAHNHDATHREGNHSGSGRGHAGPVSGEKREATARAAFASVGGWVVSQ